MYSDKVETHKWQFSRITNKHNLVAFNAVILWFNLNYLEEASMTILLLQYYTSLCTRQDTCILAGSSSRHGRVCRCH